MPITGAPLGAQPAPLCCAARARCSRERWRPAGRPPGGHAVPRLAPACGCARVYFVQPSSFTFTVTLLLQQPARGIHSSWCNEIADDVAAKSDHLAELLLCRREPLWCFS
jgi:hypothetical protein